MDSLKKSPIPYCAPAKINLALHILGKRSDGFHDLETLSVFTEFSDTLYASESLQDEISVLGSFAQDLPQERDNLIWKACSALRYSSVSKKTFPVSFILKKRIPIEAGMGGGSSNAAAALKSLNYLWKLNFTNSDLEKISVPLGADVPMCLVARPLIASGKGEVIHPIKMFPKLNLVLVNSGECVSTARVFSLLKNPKNAPLPVLKDFLTFDHLVSWLKICRNDLLDAACSLAPTIADVLSALTFHGSAVTGMSGSGATCFGLFDRPEKAEHAARTLKKSMPEWFVVATETNHQP